MAPCSESMGMRERVSTAPAPAEPSAPHPRAASRARDIGMMRSPPTTSDSLFASASTLPATSASKLARSPAAPTSEFTTTSTSSARTRSHTASIPAPTETPSGARATARAAAASSPSATRVTPNARACSISSVSRVPAASVTMRTLSGWRRATSSVCVPIEPVDPSTATRRGAPPIEPSPMRLSSTMSAPSFLCVAESSPEPLEQHGRNAAAGDQQKRRRARRQKQRIAAIEQAAVARHERAGVLAARIALDAAFGEIAEHAHEAAR